MIEYQSSTNVLKFITTRIAQNSGSRMEQISIDNYNSSYRYFLELKCPKNYNLVSNQIEFSGEIGNIDLPNITEYVGKIFVQLIVRNNNGVVVSKSLVSKEPLFIVEPSINATSKIDKHTGDYIEFIAQTSDEIKEISKDLKNKADSGFFKGDKGDKGENGKDGTIIKINNNIVNKIEFTKNPQQQLDEKINKEEFNQFIMCPSGIVKNNIFPEIRSWKNLFYDYMAEANGYVYVSFETVNNEKINNSLSCYDSQIDPNMNILVTSALPLGYGNKYFMYIPISKGLTARLILENSEKVVTNSLVSRFIYSKKI